MNILEAPSADLLAGIRKLLAEKNIATADEIAERIRITDEASPARGAAMVARAWTDPAFKELMLRDGAAAAESMGVPMRGMPPLGVLENTPDLHNLVVCTLCSCYPRAVLGYPPFWFKSAAYRARAVRDPRGMLVDFGTVIPAHVALEVVDNQRDSDVVAQPTALHISTSCLLAYLHLPPAVDSHSPAPTATSPLGLRRLLAAGHPG